MSRPRLPARSFALFMRQCHREYRHQHPDSVVDFGRFSKLCATRWAKLTPEQKAPFVSEAKEAMNRYHQQRIAYQQTLPQKPKRPINAFLRFMQDNRSEVIKQLQKKLRRLPNSKEIVREASRRWRKASTQQKRLYQQQSQSDFQKYRQQRRSVQN